MPMLSTDSSKDFAKCVAYTAGGALVGFAVAHAIRACAKRGPDPGGLKEFSVVYSDRALNHMSKRFQGVMNDISSTMKVVYQADYVAIVPGAGTFGMEAVARQFAKDKRCLILRNGFFSYRWTQIFETCNLPSHTIVLKALPDTRGDPTSTFSPHPIEHVIKVILEDKPQVVFAPHVETSAGIIISDEYIRDIASTVHSVGGIFVLDCIASGTLWVDMKSLGVDVLISAPQKGWSGPSCCGIVMLSQRARDLVDGVSSDTFACNLGKWLDVMEKYEDGGHMYFATMPTDALAAFRDVINEARGFGFDSLKKKQWELGTRIREILSSKGIKSVAGKGNEAPGVVVCYTSDPKIVQKFQSQGLQIAGGVPLKCDEPEGFMTFRIGLFGLDKLKDINRTVKRFEKALDKIIQ